MRGAVDKRGRIYYTVGIVMNSRRQRDSNSVRAPGRSTNRAFSRRAVSAALLLACGLTLVCAGKTFDGPGGPVRLESRMFGATEYVPLLDLADALGLSITWSFEARRIELRNRAITVDLLAGSRFVLVDKQEMRQMSATLVFSKGEAFIPAMFATATLQPYAQRFASGGAKTPAGTRVVVIDPGHGGKDTGAIGCGRLEEKGVTLDIARRVRSALAARGVKARLTRDDDVFVELERRSDIANELGAAVFVSIHANATDDKSDVPSGSETFYLSKAQTGTDSVTERMENAAGSRDLFSGWRLLPQRLKNFFLTRHFSKMRDNSRDLAQRVQAGMARAAVGRSRGVKTANFEVLREAYCAACLTEIGFLNNPTDATYLRRSWYRQKLAEAIADGIDDYLQRL